MNLLQNLEVTRKTIVSSHYNVMQSENYEVIFFILFLKNKKTQEKKRWQIAS